MNNRVTCLPELAGWEGMTACNDLNVSHPSGREPATGLRMFPFQQDIQKRLSLPADLRLPLSVVEKLNATPTLDQPLTRKNRRVSLVSPTRTN